ncbi:MAG: iron ABC transporter permease [Elusimicrobiota bacterium]|jgi:iron complex transport system permease protein|nr:iron ABC transporter permease [Elusimicrobiota bacterium]
MGKKIIFIYILLTLVLFTSFIFSIALGSRDIDFVDIIKSLFSDRLSEDIIIVKSIRLPRAVMSILVGAGLSTSGAAFQAILKNPLADPFTLGLSGGASFGAAIAFVFGISANLLALPFLAFAGSLSAVFIVYIMNSSKSFGTNSILLSGVIVSYIFSSAVILLFAISDANRLQLAFMWLIGNFSSFDERLLAVTTIAISLGIIVLCFLGNIINVLSLSGDKPKTFGLNIKTHMKIIFLIASLITAVCTASCGIIGFVGLMTPHIMRKFVGANNVYLLPACAFAGAAFLSFCDTLSRIIFVPVMLPVGVITNIVGGAFFALLLFKGKRND